ncbi:MAG: imidazole glycerol phosphate synthase subunit HisH [Candidatus Omnitrophica bacterium]|nr:imidazole glycerol phosphate synthase subunit HisH [Candidatus Omnitrophota bacterium]
MGNIKSIQNALAYLGIENEVISSPEQVAGSQKLILPGVGSFAKAMGNIERLGFLKPINTAVLMRKVPILGICLGMQLFAESGDEDGPKDGFGWIRGHVRRISPKEGFKVPHIGFNTAYFSRSDNVLFEGLEARADFYFVHSYVLNCSCESDISSWTDNGERFASSICRENVFGTQFHPEKSQHSGLRVLKNFASYERIC